MSKIFLKSTRTPLLVQKSLAEKIDDDLILKRVPRDQMIKIIHAEGRMSVLFDDIKGVDVNNDFDYRAKLNENKNESDNPKVQVNVWATWNTPAIKQFRSLAPEEKIKHSTNFKQLVWGLFRTDPYTQDEASRKRLLKFYKENPNRTLPDVDTIVGERQRKSHSMPELSVIDMVFSQLKNDRHYAEKIPM